MWCILPSLSAKLMLIFFRCFSLGSAHMGQSACPKVRIKTSVMYIKMDMTMASILLLCIETLCQHSNTCTSSGMWSNVPVKTLISYTILQAITVV